MRSLTKTKKNTLWFVGCNVMGRECVSGWYLDEKAIKEVLKKIIENNNNILYKAKEEIKAIIELEHNPEKLLQECLLYMLSYKDNLC